MYKIITLPDLGMGWGDVKGTCPVRYQHEYMIKPASAHCLGRGVRYLSYTTCKTERQAYCVCKCKKVKVLWRNTGEYWHNFDLPWKANLKSYKEKDIQSLHLELYIINGIRTVNGKVTDWKKHLYLFQTEVNVLFFFNFYFLGRTCGIGVQSEL